MVAIEDKIISSKNDQKMSLFFLIRRVSRYGFSNIN